MPYKVLREPEFLLDSYREFEVDGHTFINKYFRQNIGTYTNACNTAGIEFVGSYSLTIMMHLLIMRAFALEKE